LSRRIEGLGIGHKKSVFVGGEKTKTPPSEKAGMSEKIGGRHFSAAPTNRDCMQEPQEKRAALG